MFLTLLFIVQDSHTYNITGFKKTYNILSLTEIDIFVLGVTFFILEMANFAIAIIVLSHHGTLRQMPRLF